MKKRDNAEKGVKRKFVLKYINNMRATTTIKSICVANRKRLFCCLLQLWRIEKYIKKSKVALTLFCMHRSMLSTSTSAIKSGLVDVVVHGSNVLLWFVHSWNSCLYRIRIWNTCHFRVCVLVILCPCCWILLCIILS